MSEPKTIEFNGTPYKLACNVPDVFPTMLPSITTAPGFLVWSKSQIEDAIRDKKVKRRKQFSGKDWILQQASIGSCNGAACIGALRRAMTLGGRNEVPQLSWEFLYAQINGGRDQGSMLVDGMEALLMRGAPPLDLSKHPLNKHWRASEYDAADREAAGAWKAEACWAIDDELELATMVLSGQGGANVAVHVGNNFTRLDSQGIAGAATGPGNHAVVVDDVEIIDGTLAFDMANSWSENYGDGGRAYLIWSRHFKQTVKNHRFFAVLAASNPGGVPVA